MQSEKQEFLIKGKPVPKEIAFNKIKILVNNSKGIHIDGLSCDMDGLDQIFLFAEKNNASLDHMNGKNISKFLSIFQRTGGNIASLGEVQRRSDYILLIGLNKESLDSNIISSLLKKKNSFSRKRVIQFISESYMKRNELSLIKVSRDKLSKEIEDLHFMFKSQIRNNIKINKHKMSSVLENINNSSYGTIIFDSTNLDNFLIREIIDFVKTLSDYKKFNFFHYGGENNISGAIQTSLWKTGFPLRVNFTDDGPIFNPLEFHSNKVKGHKELQIYISCFDDNPKVNFFKKNILIGSSRIKNKEQFDVFIPSSIPGIDQDGLIVRSDGVCIQKLKKKNKSDFKSVKEIFHSFNY
tara:strand:- start:151 stop:1209 length:1059 start_codon:yes stop_codon:yes gene_type:complete